MEIQRSWDQVTDALGFAVSRIVDDPDPLNEREAADGHQYVMRMLTAVADSSLLTVDPQRPAFMPMLESVRYVGACGPDIDYDVALILPGARYRIAGIRGGASFVGIAVYAQSGEHGASAILAAVDVDDLAGADGAFVYEFDHPEAARVIARQYFHDRSTQQRGQWTIEPVPANPQAVGATALPTVAGITDRVVNAAESLRWNAQLNQLWSPEGRATPNAFVRQTADDIVAAITNPEVVYCFSWWRVNPDEALEITFTPPQTRYWGLQICDRWFQSYPDRRMNLNDQQVVHEEDGSVRLVLADGDPGHPNWLDTSGHRVGTMFFRWLHADPAVMPRCRIVAASDVPTL